MKFGKYLKNNLIKKWKCFYVDYKSLKKNIKNNGDNYENLLNIEIDKLNRFINLIKIDKDNYDNLSKFLVMNYMALFKSIKKFDKKLLKNKKIEFFINIKRQPFYNFYKSLPRDYSKTKLVIFDKDGTLINHEELFSNWLVKQVNNFGSLINKVELYNKLGFNYKDNTFNSGSIVARGTNDEIRNCFYNFIFNNSDLNREDTMNLVKDKWIELKINYDNLIECGNTKKVFEFLRSKNIKIAICTSDDRNPTEKTIDILNLNNYIDFIACGDDNISSKPSPEPLWRICNKLNVNVENTVMVGDTISDIHAGLNSKCGKIIGVLSGQYNGFNLDEADIILNNIDDIPNLFEKNLLL